MQVSDLTTLILSWVDDPQAGYFTPANTLSWLNLAQRKVQLKLIRAGQNYYEKQFETLTVAGQQAYVLPSDYLQSHRLEIVLSGTGVNEAREALDPITTNETDLYVLNIGQPEAYAIQKDRILLWPTPSLGNLTLRLYYSPRIQDLVLTTDTPDVPEQFMEYVAILAAFNAFIKDDRTPENLMAMKTEYEMIFKSMSAERRQDRSRRVVQTQDYEFTGWS